MKMFYLNSKPELADKAFDIVIKTSQYNVNDSRSLDESYCRLSEIAMTKPELADKAFDAYKTLLQSDKNDSQSLEEAYYWLSEIVKTNPELADKVLDTVIRGLQSDKNNEKSLQCAHSSLSEILKAKPELADQVFDAYKIGAQTDYMAQVYKSLSNSVKNNPELIPEALDVCKKGIKNNKQCEYAKNCIKTIAKDNPNAVSTYLGITTKEIQTADVVALVEKTKYKPKQKSGKKGDINVQNTTNDSLNNDTIPIGRKINFFEDIIQSNMYTRSER